MTNSRTLEEHLAHCDGKDCTCMAWSESECACDADWTPVEVYRLRAAERERWQPIETAPRETPVWLWDGSHIFIGEHVFADDGDGNVRYVNVEVYNAMRDRAEKAEAELAALRKRVDNAPTGTLLVNYSHGQPISANVAADDGDAFAAIDQCSVRLVVDDA